MVCEAPIHWSKYRTNGHAPGLYLGMDKSFILIFSLSQFPNFCFFQFPYSFEFNEYFLTFVLDHLYSCLFGTFLYNSDKERKQNGVRQYTQSLWSFVNHKRDMFLNPLYNGGAMCRGDGVSRIASASALFPVTTVRYMKLWTGYYCRLVKFLYGHSLMSNIRIYVQQ